ncbi:hypothetical protein I2I05_21650 [Hymenobacter sp. BT683]|uniref:Transposase n=1 Tax=Hymenobacter jeongseonensis TaxID=2791027 RepID=A0ABS0INR1_9BACT|nr:hypothetical protein [Hymenobacter jeongseonensis]MBF9240010.1 hypothetical protein [Hymenobacter jeongseonensis]
MVCAAARCWRFSYNLLYRSQAEQTHTATHEATGLTVKVHPRPDDYQSRNGPRGTRGLNTTSAPDYAHLCAAFAATIQTAPDHTAGGLYSCPQARAATGGPVP